MKSVSRLENLQIHKLLSLDYATIDYRYGCMDRQRCQKYDKSCTHSLCIRALPICLSSTRREPKDAATCKFNWIGATYISFVLFIFIENITTYWKCSTLWNKLSLKIMRNIIIISTLTILYIFLPVLGKQDASQFS